MNKKLRVEQTRADACRAHLSEPRVNERSLSQGGLLSLVVLTMGGSIADYVEQPYEFR
jgi:hypothetical protein